MLLTGKPVNKKICVKNTSLAVVMTIHLSQNACINMTTYKLYVFYSSPWELFATMQPMLCRNYLHTSPAATGKPCLTDFLFPCCCSTWQCSLSFLGICTDGSSDNFLSFGCHQLASFLFFVCCYRLQLPLAF